jgi:hypothetical protein
LAGVQVPPLLQGAQVPALQTMPVPHIVPAALLPLSTQTDEPVAQDVVPVLHALGGWHTVPAVQETHIPARQTRSEPQVIPSGWFIVVSVQTAPPVSQASVPLWQGLVGGQLAPAMQATQAPLVHTMLAPQGVPLGLFPDVTHAETPVAHEVIPALHGSVGWQVFPAAQALQIPLLHTLSVPHDVPFVIAAAVSVQLIAGAQTLTPA